MDATQFAAPQWGRAVSTGGSASYVAFVPEALPKDLPLDPKTSMALSIADSSLGRLAGVGRILPAPHLLFLPYLTREAVASSRIEGTQASISDVFEARATGDSGSADVKEVANYIAALNHGIDRLASLPVSTRLIREMHQILLTDVRGQERTPGELRLSQNWIGSDRPSTALFVPPTVEDMKPALSDWEHYAHDQDPDLPLLIRTALLHYQFETIHPFLDGNGRLGRLFVVLYLVEQGVIPAPLLPLSAALERRRSEYYERLQAVRERGEIQEWLRFFLNVVADTATDSITRAERLVDLREGYLARLAGSRSRANEVVDLIMSTPVITTRQVADQLGVSVVGAGNLLRQLKRLDVVSEQRRGNGIATLWRARDVLAAVSD
jgi:Fic family protein